MTGSPMVHEIRTPDPAPWPPPEETTCWAFKGFVETRSKISRKGIVGFISLKFKDLKSYKNFRLLQKKRPLLSGLFEYIWADPLLFVRNKIKDTLYGGPLHIIKLNQQLSSNTAGIGNYRG
jgi:hypothetical protein